MGKEKEEEIKEIKEKGDGGGLNEKLKEEEVRERSKQIIKRREMWQRRKKEEREGGRRREKWSQRKGLNQKVLPFYTPLHLIANHLSPTCMYVLKSFFENPVSTSL